MSDKKINIFYIKFISKSNKEHLSKYFQKRDIDLNLSFLHFLHPIWSLSPYAGLLGKEQLFCWDFKSCFWRWSMSARHQDIGCWGHMYIIIKCWFCSVLTWTNKQHWQEAKVDNFKLYIALHSGLGYFFTQCMAMFAWACCILLFCQYHLVYASYSWNCLIYYFQSWGFYRWLQ